MTTNGLPSPLIIYVPIRDLPIFLFLKTDVAWRYYAVIALENVSIQGETRHGSPFEQRPEPRLVDMGDLGPAEPLRGQQERCDENEQAHKARGGSHIRDGFRPYFRQENPHFQGRFSFGWMLLLLIDRIEQKEN